MPLVYGEILRGVNWRDDNFKDHLSAWADDGPPVFSSDGDILTISGTTPTDGVFKTILPNTSLATYPYLVVRARASTPMQVDVGLSGISPTFADTRTISLTTTSETFTLGPYSSATATLLRLSNQSVAGEFYIDRVALCKNTPLDVTAADFLSADVIKSATAPDMLTLLLNNRDGKYVRTDKTPLGFGNLVYLWAGLTSLSRVFGGRLEERSPERAPEDIAVVTARGWGNDVAEVVFTKEYLDTTPKNLIIDIINTFVDIGTGTPYRISYFYVQDLGSAIGYLPFALRPAWDAIKEVGDLLVAQGAAPEIWVDASENLHVAPVGNFGPSEPTPSTYPTGFSIGVNQIINQFRKDVFSHKNRVDYFATASSPGDSDAWTETGTFSSTWGTERIAANTGVTISNETTIVKIGSKSVKVSLDPTAPTGNLKAAFYYPAAKNLALDISSLGSKRKPPIFDFYFRTTYNSGIVGSPLNEPFNVFFATSLGNRFEYMITSDNGGNFRQERSILNKFGVGTLDKDLWYHIPLPIGPFANEYSQLATVGSPNWNNINYVGLYYSSFLNAPPPDANATFYLDGWKILGARLRRAIDTSVNPETADLGARHIAFFDPVSKDEATIKNMAKAELLRLRRAVLRGSFFTPLKADLLPGQKITVTAPSADLNAATLRATKVTHYLRRTGFVTLVECSDDLTNTQPLERFRLANALTQAGHPGVKDRETYDIRAALLDPTLTRLDDNVP